VVHSAAKDLYEIGAISEARMAEFDKSCFTQVRPSRAAVSAQPRPLVTAYAGGKVNL
jgi:DNA-binding transcriptional regulator YiaG